ncbi:methyltransferase domain-containing protein [Rodentibacter caecimuris]|uniref:SAM-dependent methyltransferase n=1 Tax=Rodentibacter caecimuris TaxID=1796644 RepID=A0ABX3KWJ4_9PAST|nr:SAM-dependent methyltransferase [Rodentibacter heylii]
MINQTAKHSTHFEQPTSWLELPNGKHYCNSISSYIAPWLSQILGDQWLKVGALSGEIQCKLALGHQIALIEKQPSNLSPLYQQNQSIVQAKLTQYPFVEGEINACLLINTLNFSHDPHQLLRETQRVLSQDGYLFLTLFNPISPLIFKRRLGQYPFRQYLPYRISDWLSLLNFDLLEQQNLPIKPNNSSLFSPLTLFVAQKRTYPLIFNPAKENTPITSVLDPIGAFTKISSD